MRQVVKDKLQPEVVSKTKAKKEMPTDRTKMAAKVQQLNCERSRIGPVAIAFGSPQRPDRQAVDTSNPYRNRGILEYQVYLGPGEERTFEFLAVMFDGKKIAGPITSAPDDGAIAYFNRLKGHASELLAQKAGQYAKHILGGE